MGFFYILIGIAVFFLLFCFTKNNKEIAWIAAIPIIILFFSGICLLTLPEDSKAFIEKYNFYKSINSNNYEDPMVKYKMTKDIISINEHILGQRDLKNDKFFSIFTEEGVAELELIEIK